MAKRKKSNLPSVAVDASLDDTKVFEAFDGTDSPPKKRVSAKSTAVVDEMPYVESTLSVPMSTMRHGYEPRRCDVQQLTANQRGALRRIANGLIARGDTLENGRVIRTLQDAVKWLLENSNA